MSLQIHSLVQQATNHHYSAHHTIKQQVARRLHATDLQGDMIAA